MKKERFRGKSGEPAKHFVGKLSWCDSTIAELNLNTDPASDKVELVRYIPQGHFEGLCNDHVSGRTNAFEGELRGVIFSHAGESIRLGALDFDQLIDQQESSFRDQLNEFRKDLKRLNQEISAIETQLQADVKRSLQELLTLKNRQIDEHRKIKPAAQAKPTEELTPEQKLATKLLEEISTKLKTLEEKSAENANADLSLAGKTKALQNIRERLRLLERSHKQFEEETSKDMAVLGLAASDIVTMTIRAQPLDQLAELIPLEQQKVRTSVEEAATLKTKLLEEQILQSAKLNAPLLSYQQSLAAIQAWETKLTELIGLSDAPETQKGLQTRIAQLESLPLTLKERQAQRLKLAGEIFDILNSQRTARELLFRPVQDLILNNTLIREEYKLQFQATLGGSPESIATSLFALIKQNSGEFRGGDESFAAVRKLAEKYDFNKRADILAFVSELNQKIINAASGGSSDGIGIAPILRTEVLASDVYDLLFGLTFLEPRYSLLFQETQIEQLSPGQRGALLLIFYLLVDKGRNPIILDQPEENLDNETVGSSKDAMTALMESLRDPRWMMSWFTPTCFGLINT